MARKYKESMQMICVLNNIKYSNTKEFIHIVFKLIAVTFLVQDRFPLLKN
jgi:hypothetical protein